MITFKPKEQMLPIFAMIILNQIITKMAELEGTSISQLWYSFKEDEGNLCKVLFNSDNVVSEKESCRGRM